ncbi:precorrin-2 dehydrogenase/sirohydrochlorin ferrochelatase family protein [Tundrisphaera sp. TA3]|uniref:precorrin-2 dehydrogenase/sirohydrochlorin ferrochelatase family protein n=1 Tax=Tundrisphaera sp. TA3 TaxID=3435775 RepID=UPI003EBA8C21
MAGYLIELDLREKRSLVVGLGVVGLRKAKGLADAGASVLAVDPDESRVAPAGVELRAEAYDPDHLDGIHLAFAAASMEVNRRVVADARSRGIWVNAASEPGSGDFLVPATYRDGPVAVAVSTSGASPRLAATIRDRVAAVIGPEAAGLAALLAELRPELMEQIRDPEERRRRLAAAGSPYWLDRFASLGREAARSELRDWFGLSPRADKPR